MCLLEHKGIVSFRKSCPNIGIHGVDVSPIHRHALPREIRCIIDRHTVQVGMFLPVFVKDKQQLLSTSKSKSREQDVATASDDSMYQICEPQLLLVPRLQALHAVRAFHNEDVRAYGRHFGFDEMSVFFAGVVARVENLDTGDVDEEHAGAQDVASVVRGEGDTRTGGDQLMGGHRDDRRDRH